MNESILRTATFNIRFDTHECPPASQNEISAIVIPSEAPWNVRRIKIADTIIFHRIELVGIQVKRTILNSLFFYTFFIDLIVSIFVFFIIKQEALYNQITDLENLLGSDWNWIGVGREDGKKAGEFVPIFYKK